MDTYISNIIVSTGHLVLLKIFDHDTFNLYLPLFSRRGDGVVSDDSKKYFYYFRKTVFAIYSATETCEFNLHMSILAVFESFAGYFGKVVPKFNGTKYIPVIVPNIMEIMYEEILENKIFIKLVSLWNSAVIRMPYYESGRKLLSEIIKNNTKAYCVKHFINYFQNGNLNIAKIIYTESKFELVDVPDCMLDEDYSLEVIAEYIVEIKRIQI